MVLLGFFEIISCVYNFNYNKKIKVISLFELSKKGVGILIFE